MIRYSTGSLGCCFVWSLKGSVFPKGLVCGLPSAVVAYILHVYCRDALAHLDGFAHVWTSYTFVLGLLIVFRNNHAYARFWESATLVHEIGGFWKSAISGVIAYCSQKDEKSSQVREFQHMMVRLMSLLHCLALQQVADLEDNSFDVIGIDGLDKDSLAFLWSVDDRCEVVLQWLQRSIMDAQAAGILTSPPPILSRAFQELSLGMVKFNNVRKIRDTPLPFPYEQMLQIMLMINTVVVAVLAAARVESLWVAVAISLLVTSSFWSLLYIAREIDDPFGEDMNDFNMYELQHNMNSCLLTLLHPLAQKPPSSQIMELTFSSSQELRGSAQLDTDSETEMRAEIDDDDSSVGGAYSKSTPLGTFESVQLADTSWHSVQAIGAARKSRAALRKLRVSRCSSIVGGGAEALSSAAVNSSGQRASASEAEERHALLSRTAVAHQHVAGAASMRSLRTVATPEPGREPAGGRQAFSQHPTV